MANRHQDHHHTHGHGNTDAHKHGPERHHHHEHEPGHNYTQPGQDHPGDHGHRHEHAGHHGWVHDHAHHHGHDHGHAHHVHPGNRKGLTIALIITASIMLLEFVGGLVTNSLALLSDSAHMLSDVGALALSLIALWFAAKPPSASKTYGFYRFEILAALFNGVTLFVMAGFILYEAYERFMEPPEVAGGLMLAVAAIGLLANMLSAWMLIRNSDTKENINVRSAYLHILGDALGSVGAIVAGLAMLLTGWYILDPIISVLVALLILRGAWRVISHAIHILMEGTPVTIDIQELTATLQSIDGVIDVHDLHVWTITSGMDTLSCHLLVTDSSDCQEILQEAIRRIEERFRIQHTTIQVEKSQLQHAHLTV